MKANSRILGIFAALWMAMPSANAQSVPSLINYQGKLSNPDGTPLPTADYQLSFSIYDGATTTISNDVGHGVLVTNGLLVWGPQVFDSQIGQGHGSKIPVVQGYFNVMLGPVDTLGNSLASAFSGPNRFIELSISNGPPIWPRQQILTAPYAFNSAKLAGYDWSAVFGTSDPVNGKIPGTSLTLGSVSSNQLASQTISAAQIATNSITYDRLTVSTVSTNAPLGGVALSDSCGNYSITDGSPNFSSVFEASCSSHGAALFNLLLFRNQVQVGFEGTEIVNVTTANVFDVAPGFFRFLDTPSAGTNVYQLRINTVYSDCSVLISHMRMMAREL